MNSLKSLRTFTLLAIFIFNQILIVQSFHVDISDNEEVASLLKKISANLLRDKLELQQYIAGDLPSAINSEDIYYDYDSNVKNLVKNLDLPEGYREKKSGGITVSKRYTQAQDSASDYCTGLCMYQERVPYSRCYGLCHWTGGTPSPWVTFYQEKAEKILQADAKAREAASKVYRTGLDDDTPQMIWDGEDWRPVPSASLDTGSLKGRQGGSKTSEIKDTSSKALKGSGRRLKMMLKTTTNKQTNPNNNQARKTNKVNESTSTSAANSNNSSGAAEQQRKGRKCNCGRS